MNVVRLPTMVREMDKVQESLARGKQFQANLALELIRLRGDRQVLTETIKQKEALLDLTTRLIESVEQKQANA